MVPYWLREIGRRLESVADDTVAKGSIGVESPTTDPRFVHDSARAPLGRVLSRHLAQAKPATELPGAPDGEYVVFQFDTAFERKRAAVETVTPMRDADGHWRVSGYFVR